jgi:AcrR family transcriptional regulator
MTARRADSGTTDVRGAILEAATALFTERGADGLSMRQIAGEIGYSATTIYLHFKDKDALMLAVCGSGFDEFGATLERAARSAPTPLEGLYASADAYVNFALSNPMLYDVMFIRPRKWAITAPGDPESFRGLTGLVAATMATGGIRQDDPREVAAQVWSVLHGAVSLGLVFGDQITICEPDAVARRSRVLIAALLESLAP